MTKKEQNQKIVKRIREKLEKAGILDKLDVFPVENTCIGRPRYWNNGQKNLFKIHMWDLNALSENECEFEIDKRILEAREHFGI